MKLLSARFALAFSFAAVAFAQSRVNVVWQDNIGHQRHLHRANPSHPTVMDSARFTTNRTGAPLSLPKEEGAFSFVVFGDRTGGPIEGVSVLADAVRDVNLLEPDFVITVGDLIEGYNQEPQWLVQMSEFKEIMNKLICPWFPVSGNHDVYWRGPAGMKPPGEHEKNYELHFGPLWYAFSHKNCWFIALHSDEGDPVTGEKAIQKPNCQKMSQAQFDWLKATLDKAKGADHVFLFLHHPRWLGGNYGDDWNKVHELLKAAGNVTAVFAGHIHHMRYDPRDGIEYVTLATVGGGQESLVPDAGFLHQYHIVNVRKNQIALAAMPVGEVMDVREITGKLHEECAALAQQKPAIEGRIRIEADGSAAGRFSASLTNTATTSLYVTATLDTRDSRWSFGPDHEHHIVAPGAKQTFTFDVARLAGSLDDAFRPIELVLSLEYLAPGHRYRVPEKRVDVPLDVDYSSLLARPADNHVLSCDGVNDHVAIDNDAFTLPDGPFTLECWMRARAFGERTGLITKTETSDYGIFVSNGEPGFSAYIGDRYAEAKAGKALLKVGQWHHVAGEYDGASVRVYVDGQLVAKTERSGARRSNDLPLIIGADVARRGGATSHFHGEIDEVRLSSVARYGDEAFTPARRFERDDQTILLMHMDRQLGPWLVNDAVSGGSPMQIRLQDGAKLEPARD